MARCTIIFLSVLLTSPSAIRSDDENPLLDIASSLLSNMGGEGNSNGNGLAAIGNIVGTLMQGDNANNLGALLGGLGGQEGGNPGDILSGLGGLLSGQNGQIDPSLIGSMVSMFAQGITTEAPKNREKRESQGQNLDGILNMASTFLENKNMAGFLPVIMNAVNAFVPNEEQKKKHNHDDHASFLPPFLEKAHLYWDLFINSELGRTVWQKSGLQKAMKAFTGPDGKLSFEAMFKSFENQSFRRHWIKAAAKYLTESVMHMAKPEVYQRYLGTAQYVINTFLESQGLPKKTHFNTKKPEKSITALINYSLKHYLDMDTDVSGYVKQAVDYLMQTLKMAQATSKSLASRADYNALADRITDTLNLEVIEPVLRVYRAYKHSVEVPQCQEHLMCIVNRHHDLDKQGTPGFKQGLTKLSSLVASAALSFQHGKGFWDLYNAIQSDVNCEAKYPADCAAFHEHEMKVTTEVYHSEL